MGTYVGYTGGVEKNATYKRMLDHTEAMWIEFDPNVLSYEDMCIEWSRMHSPTYKNKCQYRSAVWYLDDDQKEVAEQVVAGMKAALRQELFTSVEPATTFYKAEEYHQRFMAKQQGNG